MPLNDVRRLISASASVCQVVDELLHDEGQKTGGTGFRFEHENVLLLMTNNHVLSTDGRRPSVKRGRAKASSTTEIPGTR